MGKYIKVGVATLLSGGTPSTASKKKQVKTKKVKSVSDSPQRNVRFDCSPPDKEHVKYVTTPFSSCAKKEKKKVIKKRKEIENKKKLSFGENDGQLTETKRAKKRKVITDESKTQENGDMSETSDVVVNKPKQSKARVIKKRKEIGNKEKLSFGENDGQLTETKRAKKRKVITEESKTQENGDMSETSDVVVNKPKKSKARVIKKRKEIGNKEKLSFGENDGQLTETKRVKKRKVITQESKTQENGDMSETSDVAVKKPKQSKAREDINIIDSSDFKSRLCQNTVEISDGVKDSDMKNNDNKKKNTIFVGNLPLTYTHKKVVKLFNKFGEIDSARLRCVPVSNMNISKRVSAITKKFHPNRNSAVAYIVFKSKESVDKAVSENGMVVDDHHLRIDYASPKEKDMNKSVFVGGLPFDVEDDELWDAFKNCGEIEGVRIVRDSATGMGKGFGYVNFKSNASVELAINLNGQEIKKRKINVQRCLTKKKRNKKSYNVIATTNINNKQKGKKKKNKNKIENSKLEKDSSLKDFQGKKAEQKKKKKKNKKTKDESRKKKIKLVLNSAPKKLNKVKKPSST